MRLWGTQEFWDPAKFRAYDKATGQVIWEKELPVGTTGRPGHLYGQRETIHCACRSVERAMAQVG